MSIFRRRAKARQGQGHQVAHRPQQLVSSSSGSSSRSSICPSHLCPVGPPLDHGPAGMEGCTPHQTKKELGSMCGRVTHERYVPFGCMEGVKGNGGGAVPANLRQPTRHKPCRPGTRPDNFSGHLLCISSHDIHTIHHHVKTHPSSKQSQPILSVSKKLDRCLFRQVLADWLTFSKCTLLYIPGRSLEDLYLSEYFLVYW